MKIYKVQDVNTEIVYDFDSKEFGKFIEDKGVDKNNLYKTRLDKDLKEARKSANGFRLLGIIDDEEVNLMETEIKKIQLQDELREVKIDIRKVARMEYLGNIIIKEIEKLAKKKPLEFPNKIEQIDINENEKIATILLGDMHVGMQINDVLNQYNTEIMKKRLIHLFNKSKQYIDIENQTGRIREIHIYNLGDIVNGLIHLSTRVNNQINVIQQIMLVSELLSECINWLSQHYKIKLFDCTDNHGRTVANKDNNIDKENLNLLINWYIKGRLNGNQNIIEEKQEIKLQADLIITKIFDKVVFGMHGHLSGVKKNLSGTAFPLKIIPDYVFTAHEHHHKLLEQDGVEIISCPSFSGRDSFAATIGKYSKPMQKLIVFDKVGYDKRHYDIYL